MSIYQDERVRLHHGDCLDVLRALPDASVDAVVTDPPYGLGFMGKEWDSLPPGREWAEECLRVLKPGGHLLAFGGTRTWHRLACAVEDAGFEVRDSLAWLYGSGFPKSLDVSKAIDKAAGAERPVVGPNPRAAQQTPKSDVTSLGAFAGAPADLTGPATDSAREWQGWGTALKPAFEPVVCARKPFNAVPLGEEVGRLHHLIGGLLWLSLSPAKRAELTSPSSPAGQHEAACVSALVSAALDTSPDASDETATFSSPALASTSSNIASSWSATLGALSARTRTSTTSTASSTTTALRTLNSLLGPITSQTTMPRCGCLVDGPSSPAPSAASSSSDEWAKWLHTLSASVPATATEGIALAVASALASIAADLSGDQAAASSADPTATTGAAARDSAFEPVVVARKPLVGTVAANVLAHGTGALNIDACRIGYQSDADKTSARPGGKTTSLNGALAGKAQTCETATTDAPMTGTSTTSATGSAPSATSSSSPRTEFQAEQGAGRWPANVILDESQAATLDQQSGTTKSPPVGSVAVKAARIGQVAKGDEACRISPNGHGDSGGASRFFYVAKAPKRERPVVDGVAHPTVKPLALMRWLVRLVTPPGGVVLEPFAGSGTTVEACIQEGVRCIAIEKGDEYLPLILERIRRSDPERVADEVTRTVDVDAAIAEQVAHDEPWLFELDGEGA